jgi:hypothetical protein
MEVSGQLRTPAALPPGKEALVPIGEEDGWAPEPSRRGGEEKNSQNPDSPTRNLVAIPTELSWLLTWERTYSLTHNSFVM